MGGSPVHARARVNRSMLSYQRREMPERKFRILVIGAGFSKPAGLPLANELWDEILRKSRFLSGRAEKFLRDLDDYIEFRSDCDGIQFTRETVNFEEFLGFLDIEHYLGLRGSDTWSRDGNEGQVVVKTMIGEILSQHMPPPNRIPDLYLEFASRLQPNDYILTFNYDVLLERALDAVGKPYRLFPNRYKSLSKGGGGILDSNKEEVTILKLHGSIDWFDKSQYIQRVENFKEQGATGLPTHPVFNSNRNWGLKRLVDGPRHKTDPLLHMYRATNIEALYRQQLLFLATPWMLSPSTNKVLYSSPLEDFWHGLGQAGVLNFGVAIIGYSLPLHDVYARQSLYSLAKNYQDNYWEEEVSGHKKTPLVLVDYRDSESSRKELLNNYRFLDLNKTELHLSGFDAASLDKIFAE